MSKQQSGDDLSPPNDGEAPTRNDLERAARANARQDWFIEYLVDMIEGIGLRAPVTLSLGGSVVTGCTMSGADYFREFAKTATSALQVSFTSPGWDPTAEVEKAKKRFEEAIASFADGFTRQKAEHRPPRAYLHLSDARFFTQGQLHPANHGVLWRCRIAAIDGFTLGTLGPGEPG